MREPDITKIRLPESALTELEMVESWDWDDGIPLENLIDWINQVVARFRPDEVGDSTRSSQEFSPRSFRHYQTLGCIDPPSRVGRRARYVFRHYLQGLLVRKLLWEKVPSDQITRLMADRSEAEYKQLLFEGVELVPAGIDRESVTGDSATVEIWKRIKLADGLELNVREDWGRMSNEEKERVIEWMKENL